MTSEALHKKCSGFLVWKALYKVRVSLQYRVMFRIRNAYQQVSEFHRGGIDAYQECGL